MSELPAKPILLSNYSEIFLALEGPLGAYPYEIFDTEIEHYTGRSETTFYLERDGVPDVVSFIGPTLTGVGPSVARSERMRLLELQKHIAKALAELDGFLETFDEQ